MAPLTGIAFASNWLIIKLNQKFLFVKTTRMTTTLFMHLAIYKYGLSRCI